jgi:hypothetical protein
MPGEYLDGREVLLLRRESRVDHAYGTQRRSVCRVIYVRWGDRIPFARVKIHVPTGTPQLYLSEEALRMVGGPGWMMTTTGGDAYAVHMWPISEPGADPPRPCEIRVRSDRFASIGPLARLHPWLRRATGRYLVEIESDGLVVRFDRPV